MLKTHVQPLINTRAPRSFSTMW